VKADCPQTHSHMHEHTSQPQESRVPVCRDDAGPLAVRIRSSYDC
jgi:hypothetical protein